jgi:hypothetical protein
MFPADTVLASDRSDSSREFRGMGMRSATFPFPPTAPSVTQQTIIQQVTAAASAATTALLLLTNNITNPNQKVLNILAGTGMAITPDADGTVTFVSTSAGDGLTHSTQPWEADPAYVALRDEFHGQTVNNNTSGIASAGIGDLGWFLSGSVSGTAGGVLGGAPPNLGQFCWSNDGTANHAGYLMLGSGGNATNTNHIQGNMALADNAGWQMTWVFKLEGDIFSAGAGDFQITKKSIYVGLCGTTINAQITAVNSARPDVFIGLRYDTSATAPAISDSFYTLEVVANHSWSTAARHNTQGTTKVTNVAPAQGVWHRLDISSTTAGTVTLTLDGSSSNTLTAAIPTISSTAGAGTTTGRVKTNGAAISWTPGAAADPVESPWGAGSIVTVSGFTGGTTVWNGTWTLTMSQNLAVNWDLVTADAGPYTTGTVTVAGRPSLMPICIMGNDDTAAPTTNTMVFHVDFFSLVWNTNLGTSAPGTPDATQARYW